MTHSSRTLPLYAFLIVMGCGLTVCAPQLLKNDKAKFLATAKEWTKKCVSCRATCPFATDVSSQVRDLVMNLRHDAKEVPILILPMAVLFLPKIQILWYGPCGRGNYLLSHPKWLLAELKYEIFKYILLFNMHMMP